MCSRYRLTSSPDAIAALLRTVNREEFPPRERIAPTEPVLIAKIGERGDRRLELVRWGLIPGWAKDPRELPLLFNARAETALEKPTYRAGLRYRRCLVPADGYYDWSGSKQARVGHVITPIESGPIAFAGVWEHWLGADGSEMDSMAILTVAAGPDVTAISERMPAILAPRQFDDWLDCRGCPAEAAAAMLEPSPCGSLRLAPFVR